MILKILQNGGRGAYPVSNRKHPTGDLGRKMRTATVPLCQHWMDNAIRCGSPAMRRTQYCYSHHREHERGARKNAERTRQRWFESAPLRDTASVQRALLQVITRLLSGNIGHKQAGQILYRLQTASVNLRSQGLGLGKADDESS
jgi:hypothetical protein